MNKVGAKMVLKHFTCKSKKKTAKTFVPISWNVFKTNQTCWKTFTCDKTWIFLYDPETIVLENPYFAEDEKSVDEQVQI